ncbi:uncharacterized protein LOC117326369 [Pecten maximus]|uniref:uncharacterized protein LOC117326369 n=1 Tax=Pecten maximus TaxID=6579 RepID=UPI001458D8A6|nr:uncharacterized protein LOC117326369 [Pecten maximus]
MTSPTVQALLMCLGFYAVDSSVNVASGKPSWLSSTWTLSSRASNVVDGTKYLNHDTLFPRCIHTRFEPFPRWWVNLTGDYTISRIDIDYRRDTSYRMHGYKLIVSNTESTSRWNRGHRIAGHICYTEVRTDPPTQQTVPCLARGQYITYADDYRSPKDPNPYVELCELEALGCPTGWYGQNNCDNPCPEGCLEIACNPDNGACFHGCKTGLQGITCNTTCDDGRFG